MPIARAQTSLEGWQADIAYLQTELPKRHPNFYFYYPKKAFDSDMAALTSNLDGKSDLEIALELQIIVSRAKDASTRLELTPLLQQAKIIPIAFGWYAGGLFVSATVKKFAPALGKRVLEINGIQTDIALAKIGRFIARENDEAVRKDAHQWLRFPEANRLAGISTTDTMSLLVVDENGQRFFIQTYPLDFKNEKTGMQPAQYVPKSPDLRWNPTKTLFSLNWLESDSIVYLQYNNCLSRELIVALGDSLGAAEFPSFRPISDSVFVLLEQHPGARFFFDLRFNSGGYPADGIALAERISAKPIIDLPNRIYVAVNRYTVGAAVEIAAAFEKMTNATLIGEPPAQRPNHIGDPKAFYLPNSRIQVIYGSRPVDILPGNSDKLRLNVPLELPFQAFRDGRDPLLDYVRALRH